MPRQPILSRLEAKWAVDTAADEVAQWEELVWIAERSDEIRCHLTGKDVEEVRRLLTDLDNDSAGRIELQSLYLVAIRWTNPDSWGQRFRNQVIQSHPVGRFCRDVDPGSLQGWLEEAGLARESSERKEQRLVRQLGEAQAAYLDFTQSRGHTKDLADVRLSLTD